MLDLFAATAAFLFLGQAGAAPVAQSDEVVVTGRRVEEAVQAFVSGLSAPSNGEDQLTRWNHRVCPGVVGLRAQQAQAVADRVAIRALEVGLEVDGPGCTANVLILVTSDATSVARMLANENRALMGYYGGDANTRGRAALDDFVQTSRPVRWWHVSQTHTSDGMSIGSSGNAGEPAMVTLPSDAASHINRGTQQFLARAVVIVDAQRVGAVPVGLLGDYVAMVALAQLDPDGQTAEFPTILNLFADRAAGRTAATGLTDWDRAYLAGLYSGPPDQRRRLATERHRAAHARPSDGVSWLKGVDSNVPQIGAMCRR